MLEELARAVTFPTAPELRGAVLARLHDPPQRRGATTLRLALAAVAVAVVAGVLVAGVSSDARDAVAEFFGLGVRGERIELLPTPPGGIDPTPLPTSSPGGPEFELFATEVTRIEGDSVLGLPLRLPSSLGEPESYWRIVGGASIVIADYGDVQIWQMPYEGDYFIGKGIVGGGANIEQVPVNGHPGYWVSGGERLVSVRTSTGDVLTGTQRTVTASALLWSADGLYMRIEGAGSLEAAMGLAGEMR